MSEENRDETIKDALKKAWEIKDTRLKILLSALNNIAERECEDASETALEALREAEKE